MSNICRSAYFLMLLTATACLVSLVWKPAPPPKFTGLSSLDVPVQVGSFVSRGDYEINPAAKAALSSADIVARSYAPAGDSKPLDFVLIGGTDRSALHDPRSCLIGAGQKIEDDHVETLPGSQVQMRACRVRSNGNEPDYDMLYVYVVDGQVVDKVTQIRMQMLWSALLGRKGRPVYFMRVMLPLEGTADTATFERDHAVCQKFALQMWNALSLTGETKSAKLGASTVQR